MYPASPRNGAEARVLIRVKMRKIAGREVRCNNNQETKGFEYTDEFGLYSK